MHDRTSHGGAAGGIRRRALGLPAWVIVYRKGQLLMKELPARLTTPQRAWILPEGEVPARHFGVVAGTWDCEEKAPS
jgi:hypothetical protein